MGALLVWAVCACLLFATRPLGKEHAQIVRVLITVSPRMYRETLALFVQRHRRELDVRIAPPEDVRQQVENFQPHLLVHNDNDGLDPRALVGVLCWVEVGYSDGMDARISVGGRVSEFSDIDIDDLLKAVDGVQEQLRGLD